MPERPPAQGGTEGPPEECANCGAPIPRSARSCPECGADEKTGWRETSVYDALDLPEEAFEDEAEPHGRGKNGPSRVNGIAWYWWALAVVLILSLIFSARGLR